MKPTFNLLTDEHGYTIETNGQVHISVKEDGTTSVRIGPVFSPKFIMLAPDESDVKNLQDAVKKSSEFNEAYASLWGSHPVGEVDPNLFFPKVELARKQETVPIINGEPEVGTLGLITPAPKSLVDQLFEEDEPTPSLVEKAQEAIKHIDTSVVEEELAQQAAMLQVKETPTLSQEQMLEKAKQSIVDLDKHLSEGGRVNVGDKYLLNCQADLNQLVPFKYGWAWSLYLTSCDKHWMPSETDMTQDRVQFSKMKTSLKAILLRAWYNHQYQMLMLPTESVLNCYRLITNPECRQYTLRQVFEMCLTKHAWLFMTESLVDEETLAVHTTDTKGTKLREALTNADQTYRDRYSQVTFWLDNIHSRDFLTDTDEKIGEFVLELLIGLGYVNWIMHIPTYYQILNINRHTGQLAGVKHIILMMIKDIKTQTEYLKLLLSGIVKENPNAFNSGFKLKAAKAFGQFFDTELDIVSLSASTETEYFDVQQLLVEQISSLLASVGVNFNKTTSNRADIGWFNQMVDGVTPTVDHDAKLSGGALSFDDEK